MSRSPRAATAGVARRRQVCTPEASSTVPEPNGLSPRFAGSAVVEKVPSGASGTRRARTFARSPPLESVQKQRTSTRSAAGALLTALPLTVSALAAASAPRSAL